MDLETLKIAVSVLGSLIRTRHRHRSNAGMYNICFISAGRPSIRKQRCKQEFTGNKPLKQGKDNSLGVKKLTFGYQ